MHTTIRIALCWALCLGALIQLGDGAEAAKKRRVESYAGQTMFTFRNLNEIPAHGLHVDLSQKGWAMTDPQTGEAGPFGSIRGSNSKSIRLSNPERPIPPMSEDDKGIRLAFRSYSKKVRVTGYWWTDEKGKRIGDKVKVD